MPAAIPGQNLFVQSNADRKRGSDLYCENEDDEKYSKADASICYSGHAWAGCPSDGGDTSGQLFSHWVGLAFPYGITTHPKADLAYRLHEKNTCHPYKAAK